MTPQNLMDYVKVYKNHLPIDLCKSATKNLSNINWQGHTFYQPQTHELIEHENELAISHENIPEKQEIHKQIWFALERYIVKDFANFDKWFNGWLGYSEIRFNRYDPKTQMRIHCDHIYSLFSGNPRGIPILTVLGALNDDYDGGELIMFEDYKIHLPAGAVIIFPSNFMYPHEVKPVKSGVRYSYVSWSW